MVKSIIKEIFIMLLLCIAIVLILGVVFYSYIPTNKIIPEKIAYTTPENIKEELANELTNESMTTVVTYEIDASDLNVYIKSGSYVKGKPNPFAMNTSTDDTNSTDDENINTNTNTSSGAKNEVFYNETGTK